MHLDSPSRAGADLLRRVGKPLDVAGGEHDIGSRFREHLRDYAPEPGAATGDEGRLPVQQTGVEDLYRRRWGREHRGALVAIAYRSVERTDRGALLRSCRGNRIEPVTNIHTPSPMRDISSGPRLTRFRTPPAWR